MTDAEEVFQVGKWLSFDKNTLFGHQKQHLGIIVGIDNVSKTVGVVVNATSNIDGVKKFINDRQFSHYTIVEAQNENIHLQTPSVFNCNSAQEISFDDVKRFIKIGLVHKVAFNEDVNTELMDKLKAGIYESPLVAEKLKSMLEF